MAFRGIEHCYGLLHIRSKERRFLRIQFKSGYSLVIVPRNSIASETELLKIGRRQTGQRFNSPDIDRLLTMFQKQIKRNQSDVITRY
jgi:hypothetical protein